jgi:hypothetical protein
MAIDLHQVGVPLLMILPKGEAPPNETVLASSLDVQFMGHKFHRDRRSDPVALPDLMQLRLKRR